MPAAVNGNLRLGPQEVSLELTPSARIEVIDVNKLLAEQSQAFEDFSRASYYSYHTTAGYYDQRLVDRLRHSADSVATFVEAFKRLFPDDAGYRHDELELRSELSDAQRLVEPRNADSHLTYIGSGLESCVTYNTKPGEPVYFVELDGMNGKSARRRRTTVIGFNREVLVEERPFDIPVSSHPIDSINLRDERLGLMDHFREILSERGVSKGRIDLIVDPSETNIDITVNEYETLLMQHDLAEVIRNPMRFVAEKSYNMLRDPRSVPAKAKNYAKYDLVQLVNEVLDKFGLSESVVERVVDKFLSVPAARFLRMKRSVSLLVSNATGETGGGDIVHGTYQSPILVQWRKAETGSRKVTARFVRYE